MEINTYYLLIPLIVSILIIIILIRKNKQNLKTLEQVVLEKHQVEVLKKEEMKDYFNEEWKQEKEKIDYERKVYEGNISNQKAQLENQYKLEASKFNGELKQLEVKLQEKEKRYNEVNQDLDLYRKGKINEIDAGALEYEQRKRLLVDQSINSYRNLKLETANEKMAVTTEEIEKANQELQEILLTLKEERDKRTAINEEIRRAREVEEQQDFYKIQLNPDDTNDITLLRSITPRLRHPEAINKVIWSGYYQKPLAELRKRVAIEDSGVYKITRLKTNEIYIGQAVNVSTRWADHVKSALGVGTLASSQLHRAMAEDGPEQFTFELLEKVPKDKLRERESYYIDFYDSKNYGLNTVKGDQNK